MTVVSLGGGEKCIFCGTPYDTPACPRCGGVRRGGETMGRDDLLDRLDRVLHERDEARARQVLLEPVLDKLTAERDRLRALLREILDTYPEVTDTRILADVAAALEGRDG